MSPTAQATLTPPPKPPRVALNMEDDGDEEKARLRAIGEVLAMVLAAGGVLDVRL